MSDEFYPDNEEEYYPEFDLIGDIVDLQFEQEQTGEEIDWSVIEGEAWTARIGAHWAAQDAYEAAMAWHNASIRYGTDPESGLHGLPYVPWDERIDGQAQCSSPDGNAHRRQGGAVVGAWAVDTGSTPTAMEVIGILMVFAIVMILIFWLGG